MYKLSIVAACLAAVFSLQGAGAAARTPIHFIYTKAGATYQQFKSDTDECAGHAKRTHWFPWHDGRWNFSDNPSSTIFLNCMAEKGYALAKNGWDTGILWYLPNHPVDWHGPGWHMIEPSGFITAGPFPDKLSCEAAKPSGAHVLRCVWLDRDPEKR